LGQFDREAVCGRRFLEESKGGERLPLDAVRLEKRQGLRRESRNFGVAPLADAYGRKLKGCESRVKSHALVLEATADPFEDAGGFLQLAEAESDPCRHPPEAQEVQRIAAASGKIGKGGKAEPRLQSLAGAREEPDEIVLKTEREPRVILHLDGIDGTLQDLNCGLVLVFLLQDLRLAEHELRDDLRVLGRGEGLVEKLLRLRELP